MERKKIMTLIEQSLKYDLALEYFKECLEGTNLVSNEIMRSVNFEEGSFYTLTSVDVDMNSIYQFRSGGKINNVREHVAKHISEHLKGNNNVSCLIDDYNSTYPLSYRHTLFSDCGIAYDKEVYYLITNENDSLELIKKCLAASDCIWHSLACTFESDIVFDHSKGLMEKEILKICSSIMQIFVTAYDGDGYVIWEKRG